MQDLFRFIITELRGSWRYRWHALIAAWAFCLMGWIFVLRMPDVYEAHAQVFVDAESRLAEVMGQVGVAPGVGSQVFVVRQAMLGRPQLEYVASHTGLDQRATNEEELEALFFNLRENIGVATGRTGDSRNLYTISYRDSNRGMALAIVQTLLDTFVKDVLELNDQGSEEATGYLEDQLAHYSGLLSEAERRLAAFKKENVGLLPGESGGVFERLQVEMTSLKATQSDLEVEIDRQSELRRQLTSETPFVPGGGVGSAGATILGSPTEEAIKQLETQRSQLLLAYTDRHPDVVAINEQLALLYVEVERERDAMAGSATGIEGAANSTNPVYQGVQIALNDSSVRIATLRSQIQQRERVVRELNSQINTIPEVEATYSELTRNYAQYQSLYDELLEQRERERMGTAGADREVVSFNITEPPAAGLEPVAPLRGLFLVAVLVIGLGAGGLLAWIFHQMNPVYFDAKTLRQITNRPVLGVISMTWLERNKIQRRFNILSFLTASLALVIVCGVLILFNEQLVSLMGSIFRDSAA
jgi:polysaccharide chain length determinant protein (PEP-CTERM system associated)